MFGQQLFNEIDTIQREMENFFRGTGFSRYGVNEIGRITFHISETDDNYLVQAAAPGIDMEKLDINVLGRELKISGETPRAELPEGAQWLRQERRCGKFEQNFRLPHELEHEKIEASYENGMLKIVLPKAASAQPKRITVKAA
jgi:HSP20 family protein